MKNISLNYGKSLLSVPLPEDLTPTIIRKKLMPLIDDPVCAIEEAFEKPVGGESLIEVARNADQACI